MAYLLFAYIFKMCAATKRKNKLVLINFRKIVHFC